MATHRHRPLPNNDVQSTFFSRFHRHTKFPVLSILLEHGSSLSPHVDWARLLEGIPAIHLGIDVVIPFQLMASLPHGGLQVTTKCILEVTGLDTVQTTFLCQAHEIRAS